MTEQMEGGGGMRRVGGGRLRQAAQRLQCLFLSCKHPPHIADTVSEHSGPTFQQAGQ